MIHDNRNRHSRKNWTPAQYKINWIEACLVNNENATDEALMEFLMREGEMDKEVAIMIMRQRNKALREPMGFELDIEGLNL